MTAAGRIHPHVKYPLIRLPSSCEEKKLSNKNIKKRYHITIKQVWLQPEVGAQGKCKCGFPHRASSSMWSRSGRSSQCRAPCTLWVPSGLERCNFSKTCKSSEFYYSKIEKYELNLYIHLKWFENIAHVIHRVRGNWWEGNLSISTNSMFMMWAIFFALPVQNFPFSIFSEEKKTEKNEVFKTRGWGVGVATKAGLLATLPRGRERENARITRRGCSAPWWGWRWWWRWRGWYFHGDDGWFLLEFWSKMIVVMWW